MLHCLEGSKFCSSFSCNKSLNGMLISSNITTLVFIVESVM